MESGEESKRRYAVIVGMVGCLAKAVGIGIVKGNMEKLIFRFVLLPPIRQSPSHPLRGSFGVELLRSELPATRYDRLLAQHPTRCTRSMRHWQRTGPHDSLLTRELLLDYGAELPTFPSGSRTSCEVARPASSSPMPPRSNELRSGLGKSAPSDAVTRGHYHPVRADYFSPPQRDRTS